MVLQPQLDVQSDTPLYRQLYEYIRSAIDQGALGVGERLPATRELAGHLGLNRTTVSAAYELLESNGLIRGHRGARGGSGCPQRSAGRDQLRGLPGRRPSFFRWTSSGKPVRK